MNHSMGSLPPATRAPSPVQLSLNHVVCGSNHRKLPLQLPHLVAERRCLLCAQAAARPSKRQRVGSPAASDSAASDLHDAKDFWRMNYEQVCTRRFPMCYTLPRDTGVARQVSPFSAHGVPPVTSPAGGSKRA